MSKALMIQGTGSGVGKSIIVAGLCRLFSDRGMNVSPFKAQNMALNSFITKEGCEIGRAQAVQAEAARIEPSVDMNPILLKATGEASSQVIMNGRVHSDMKANDYYAFKHEAWKAVTQAYERLSARHDFILIEGAGSPAEINLMEDEIVNMKVARHTNAPVLLVGDIDKGGVFASLYGTVELLKDRKSNADFIRAFIVNKFRGDISILEPGLRMIEEKTGRPVIGVIPYLGDLCLQEEDAIPADRLSNHFSLRSSSPAGRVKIVVLRLRYIANFTDFDPFLFEPGVELTYSLWDGDIESADIIFIPGSKNTVRDLLFLREYGVERNIRKAAEKGTPVIGICGGYQMLGKTIYDPYGIESGQRETSGLGFLDTETVFEKTKVTSQVEVYPAGIRSLGFAVDHKVRGYEIHMGRTTGDLGLFRIERSSPDSRNEGRGLLSEGSAKGNVWGTYIHGLFDDDDFRKRLLDSVRERKGLVPPREAIGYARLREKAMNEWAKTLEEALDVAFIYELVGVARRKSGAVQTRL